MLCQPSSYAIISISLLFLLIVSVAHHHEIRKLSHREVKLLDMVITQLGNQHLNLGNPVYTPNHSSMLPILVRVWPRFFSFCH